MAEPVTKPSDDPDADADTLLRELQHAADLHREILERQACLIARLRSELKEVSTSDHPAE